MRRNIFWQGRRALGDKPNKMLGESLWQWWARRTEDRLSRNQLWDVVEPYQRPKPIAPLAVLNIVAFYSGVVAAAVTEQMHKIDRFDFSVLHALLKLVSVGSLPRI
ncbi:uncharacterized protein At4g29660 isoform X2 [Physcomitrium patens]|uniref:Uncharacterized protein n=1 Tax=Physcomitrium patens TaxID=3218 RepID=A0A7I4F2U1_PHYPA|nr:uncharacterized protein At4g29660-like isoform X2 [Physcomitrium patens]|eukprot:XP_024393339.1 uncharacterized protein At4g29660-like isoform X2 [Physcomitrella patens]